MLSGCDFFSFSTKSKIVLQVEKRSMTLSQFSMALAHRLKELDPLSAKDPSVLKTFKTKVTTDFIVDALIEQWFADQKLSIDSKVLDDALAKTIAQFPSDKEFRDELASQNKSYQDWRRAIEIGLKRDVLFTRLRKEMSVPTNEELEAYYQENKLKYFQNESVNAESILLQDENQADVIKKLYKKTSFENLFKEYSLDRTTPQAMKYGWIERASGSPLEALFVSKKSELIGPIQVAEGYRLYKITQRKSAFQRQFSDVSQQVKAEVVALRESARFSAWLDEQIKKYKILRNTEAIDALVVETREE
jgi:parvulin-like peptidyl-prolyl isomerase